VFFFFLIVCLKGLKMRVMRTLVVVALLACAMTTVFADEVEKAPEAPAEEIPVENVPVEDQEMQTGEAAEAPHRSIGSFSHPGVKVTAMIPDYLGKEIPAGEDIEMIVWFSNQVPIPMTVNGIFAALQSSMDSSRFIQNFTPRGLNLRVEGNTETSISYKFHPSEYLTAMPYRFFSIIEYSDENKQRYFNVLFNETLGFGEANVAFDVELIMTYLVIVGFFAGCGYLIYSCVATKTSGKTKVKKTKQPSEEVPHEENEWLAGTSARKSGGSSPAPKKKKTN